jgi:transmembrane sensor
MSFRADLRAFLSSPLHYLRERRLRSLTREALALVSMGADRAPGFETALALWLLRSKDHVAVWLDVTAFYEEAARSLHYPELGNIAMALHEGGGSRFPAEGTVQQTQTTPHATEPALTDTLDVVPEPRAVATGLRALLVWPAFGLGIALALAVLVYAGFRAHDAWTRGPEHSTRIGEHRTFTLADGTRAHLNTNSLIAVHFTNDARVVELQRGEALFDVAPDLRPFRVIGGTAVIEDIGTQFNVRLEAARVDVAVLEGQVRVGVLSPGATPEKWMRVAVDALNAGESVSLETSANANAPVIRRNDSEKLTRKMSWTRGMLQFRSDSLLEAVREFNRYNVRQIEIVDPGIASLRIGGQFQATSPDRFARALSTWGVTAIEPPADAPQSAPIRLLRSAP